MVETVQKENTSSQLIDNAAAIEQNAATMKEALKAGGGSVQAPAAAASGPKSDLADFVSIGINGSKYAKAAEVLMTGMADASSKRDNGMIFGGSGKGRRGSRFMQTHEGGMSAMPSSYSDRKMMDRMERRPDKKELADRKLADMINGTTSGVAGHSYAHGNSAVMVSGGKISEKGVAQLSAVVKLCQQNIETATNNMRMPSAERINYGLQQGHNDAELWAKGETDEQRRKRLAGTSAEFKHSNINAAPSAPQVPKPAA